MEADDIVYACRCVNSLALLSGATDMERVVDAFDSFVANAGICSRDGFHPFGSAFLFFGARMADRMRVSAYENDWVKRGWIGNR